MAGPLAAGGFTALITGATVDGTSATAQTLLTLPATGLSKCIPLMLVLRDANHAIAGTGVFTLGWNAGGTDIGSFSTAVTDTGAVWCPYWLVPFRPFSGGSIGYVYGAAAGTLKIAFSTTTGASSITCDVFGYCV